VGGVERHACEAHEIPREEGQEQEERREEKAMLRGLTSFQLFVDDVAEAERWYSNLLGIEPYFRSEDHGLPAGHIGFKVGDSQGELGLTDRKLAPEGMGTGPGGTVAYWQVDDVSATFDRLISSGAKPLQPPTELSRGFMIASLVDPFGNVLGLRFDPDFQ
jgi:predicted enzyme related to lactoylglutathione lyase